MINLDFINNIMKIIFINLCTYFIFLKITNYKNINSIKIIILIMSNIIIAIIYTVLLVYINVLFTTLVTSFIYSIILAFITNNKIEYSVVITVISLAISFVLFDISMIISGIIIFMLGLNDNQINVDSPIILLSIIVIELFLLHFIFKIKRFKNGFSFLQGGRRIETMGLWGICICGMIILIYRLLGNYREDISQACLLVGLFFCGIGIVIWIQRSITQSYKQKMKEKIIQELENEVIRKNEEIEKLSNENSNFAKIIHKYNNRLSALELGVKNFTNKLSSVKYFDIENSSEYSDVLKQINKISEEYNNELINKIKYNKKILKSNIFGIDSIFEYMSSECKNNNIDFNLNINGSINYMIENVILQSKLETLIADHIRNAIIAINSKTDGHRKITIMLGIIDNCYEFSVYDSGVEFTIDTLLNLGLKQVTTHSDDGGSGIGFMTTFEILKEYNASLIIEEMETDFANYTKAVIIRFDGKKEYRVCSYRSEEIILKNEDNRIIVQKMS